MEKKTTPIKEILTELEARMRPQAEERKLILTVSAPDGLPALGLDKRRIAQVLTQDMGLVPGNRILLRGGNSPMMAACLLGALKAGLVAVPTMPLLRASELAQIIDKAQVSAALCDSLLAEELQHCMTPGHASHVRQAAQGRGAG